MPVTAARPAPARPTASGPSGEPALPETAGLALAFWLAHLTGGPVARGEQIVAKLTRFNRTPLTPQGRLEAMDALEPGVNQILADLNVRLVAAAQPLSVEDRLASFIARDLADGMAEGYSLAATEWPQEGARASRPALGPVLMKAVRFAAAALHTTFLSYARVPSGAWRKLHALYLMAERRGVATGAADPQSRRSVTEAYGEALLVALTDPWRLRPGEVDRIVALLRPLRVAPTIGREPPATHATAHFIVPCDIDQAPRSAMLADEDAGGPNWRILDANPVVDALREILAELNTGRRTPPALATVTREEARSLVERLIRLWDNPPKRAYRRETASGSVAICVGVKPIAHFVAHDAMGVEEDVAQAEALRKRLTMPLKALPEDEEGNLIPIHEWNVVNLSAGGMKVRRSASTSHPIAVGEVVGIRTPGKALWTIGAVRWINGLDDGGTEFGVQFFAEAACAVWIKRPVPSSPPRLGLLVTSGYDAAAEALLAPRDTCRSGEPLDLRGEGLRYRVNVTEALERTAAFELFRFEAA